MDLSCTKCGGPLPPEAARAPVLCEYCGTTSVPPPEVIERFVPRGRFTDPNEAPRPSCPRCADFLVEKPAGVGVLSTCRSCGGLWLDTATVDRLRNARDEALELAVRRIADPKLDATGRDLRVAITCPICRTRLRRVPIPNSAHDVDVCDAHGTWFDRVQGDELQMFINAFEAARTPASDDDLRPAGLGDGFFSRLFRSRA